MRRGGRGSQEWKGEELYIQMDSPMLICIKHEILEPKNTLKPFFAHTQRSRMIGRSSFDYTIIGEKKKRRDYVSAVQKKEKPRR